MIINNFSEAYQPLSIFISPTAPLILLTIAIFIIIGIFMLLFVKMNGGSFKKNDLLLFLLITFSLLGLSYFFRYYSGGGSVVSLAHGWPKAYLKTGDYMMNPNSPEPYTYFSMEYLVLCIGFYGALAFVIVVFFKLIADRKRLIERK